MLADAPPRATPRRRRPRTILVILGVALAVAVAPLCLGFGFLLAGSEAYFLEAQLALTLSVLLLTLLGIMGLLWSWRTGFLPARSPIEGLALVIGCGGGLFLGLLFEIFARPSILPPLVTLAWGGGGFLLAGLFWGWRHRSGSRGS